MGNIVQLTAYKVGPSSANLATPRIISLTEEQIADSTNQIISKTKTGTYGSVIKIGRAKKFEVFESSLQIDTQMNPTKTGADITAAVAAAGSTQGTATLLSKYMNVVTSATAATADGVRLDAATTGKVRRVVNGTAVDIEVFPATGENINALADNLSLVVPAGQTYHFSCQTAGFWKSARVN